MVTLIIKLLHKRHLWHVIACEMTLPGANEPIPIPKPSPRKFLSQEAAISYVKRRVLADMRKRHDGTTNMDLTFQVEIRMVQ